MLRLLTTSINRVGCTINRVGYSRHLSAKVNCKEQLSKITNDISKLKTQIETLSPTLNPTLNPTQEPKEKEKLKVNDKPNISVYISPSTYLGEPSIIVEKKGYFTDSVSTRIIPQSQIGSIKNYGILLNYLLSEDPKNNKDIGRIHTLITEQYEKTLASFNNKRSIASAMMTTTCSAGLGGYVAFLYTLTTWTFDDLSLVYCSSSITALLSMCGYLKSIDYFKLSRLACLVYQINNRNNLPLCISDLTIELKYLRDAFSSKYKS
jgi:hypothetical protein